MFLLTFYTGDKVHRHFTISSDSLETGLDMINTLARQDDQLLAVRYLDAGYRLDLPVHIFGDEPFGKPIQALQQEWTHLLSISPINDRLNATDPSAWLERAQQSHQARIHHLQACQYRIHQLIERTHQQSGSANTRLIHHYYRVLHHFTDALNRASEW